MSAQTAQPAIPHIPHCRAGKITDQVLDHVTAALHDAQNGQVLTDADIALVMVTMPQICEELRQRRAAMDLIGDLAEADNVLMMPGAR